ncbi:MAG: crossover junction endodeoxyribonuclease RuvC [Acidimicrobiia bacterium]
MFVSVLGIDPGLTRCGYGIVKYDEKRIVELEKAGILSTSPQEAISSRLAEIHHDLTQIINESKPDFIAVERVLFKANVSTAMSVSQVNGLVHSLAASYSIPITEFSPTEVKNAITGHGRADKKAVQEMVMKLLRLTKIPQPADAADAIAIALTCAYQSMMKNGSTDSDNATYNGANLHNAIANAIVNQVKTPDEQTIIRESQKRILSRRRSGLSR